jgi:hypothetical protein
MTMTTCWIVPAGGAGFFRVPSISFVAGPFATPPAVEQAARKNSVAHAASGEATQALIDRPLKPNRVRFGAL